ncbi:MAG: T9SS type A sorting domain-containing protein, partial [Candidatus Eisenbacteria bacterium]|nr:T9SS type A sorting domain-containing protein [Candidatus Eisenbacteria bacterium]
MVWPQRALKRVLICAVLVIVFVSPAPGQNFSPHILVDQFGYLPASKKIAVLADPVVGFNAASSFTPGGSYEVRDAITHQPVFSAVPVAWSGGAVHGQSGDRIWHFDFSTLTNPGSYYVHDVANNASSAVFDIANDVYQGVLRDAVRTYFYQRCGVTKALPYAESNWVDGSPCHVGAEQDLDCRAVDNPIPATSLDLSGGWHDAGDYNKYINFADDPLHQLLAAYEQSPWVWPDSWGIPESGNLIPDLLDEIQWELDWFLKMQQPGGGVLHKVSVTDFSAGSPPSSDGAPRRYAPITASATISACAVFAHASIVFRSLGDPVSVAYADVLESAAEAAWAWLEANPGLIPSTFNNAGFSNAAAEDDAYQQAANRVVAAVYLFKATGDNGYRDYVDANYSQVHLILWSYVYEFETTYQDGLLAYTNTAGATPSVSSQILTAYDVGSSGYLSDATNQVDPYGAPLIDNHYVWGSNSVKGAKAGIFVNRLDRGLDPGSELELKHAIAGYVHYLHGVNPLGLAYLSNMNGRGAENSAPEFYHGWFDDGTVWDNAETSSFGPAPGFVPGGPNPNYSPDGSYGGPPIEPPQNQPIQKSYKSWNTTFPENSWEVTENSIVYQASYVQLLARMVSAGVVSVPWDPPTTPSLLVRAWPNPSRGQFSFEIEGDVSGRAELSIFDVEGRLVISKEAPWSLANPRLRWQPQNISQGVYFYRLKSGDNLATGRLVLLSGSNLG